MDILDHMTFHCLMAYRLAMYSAKVRRNQFLTPEHILFALCVQKEFVDAVDCASEVEKAALSYLEKYCPVAPEEVGDFEPERSASLEAVFDYALDALRASNRTRKVRVPDLLDAMMNVKGVYAGTVIRSVNRNKKYTLRRLYDEYGRSAVPESVMACHEAESVMACNEAENEPDVYVVVEPERPDLSLEDDGDDIYEPDDDYNSYSESGNDGDDDYNVRSTTGQWTDYVVCLNDTYERHNPLIGREEELERTIQVLCRKDKNNPLHIGEPGVGKTALAYGLAERIARYKVPERLMGCRIYSLDLMALIAGTQYRGDFESRLKDVLDGVCREMGSAKAGSRRKTAILYIDEIHNIVGAGSTSESSFDAANILKPYLETGELRFMGATTYEEYNRSFSKNKGFARRFEKIDIKEPAVEECRQIVRGLRKRYEDYHKVQYTEEAIDYAVTAADKYITGRFLPDKAIDLIDEAGAWREAKQEIPEEVINMLTSEYIGDPEYGLRDSEVQTVDKKIISEVLARMCNVESLAEDKDDAARLEHLEERIKSQIYGQDEAVRGVTEAVQMASAGLLDDNKPMASLLFVGPTGVGKTEVAKALAKELSLPLVRFDMSEYAEKHTVAKLIGSPAGYVGYEDGGLLTDAIRKSPHCVLLFDELEKAHQDIYNILLQVMDYAVLTDNKGQKADFRHVIFIMTTNAGAQYARQASVGFNSTVSAGEAMLRSVRKTFKPEFINRLTAINVFHDMTRQMAELILDKKLKALEQKLAAKGVTMELAPEAREFLLNGGFSAEYGGREVDRVINNTLKPLLMRAILFGKLKDGGRVRIIKNGEGLEILIPEVSPPGEGSE